MYVQKSESKRYGVNYKEESIGNVREIDLGLQNITFVKKRIA